MMRLLLLSAGTNACYHIAKVLKEKFSHDFYLVGADINEQYLIPTSQYLDKFYKVPYTNDPKYYDTIINICDKEKINYLLPSFDADQKLFYPENKDLQKLGIFSFGTSNQTLGIYSDKIKMYKYLSEKGFLLPKRYEVQDIEDDKEYFIKPINGVASIGARKESGAEIKTLKDSQNYIIQEICSEPEYTLECFTFQKKFSAICRERIAAKAGVCVKARVFKNPELEKIAQKFIKVVKTPYYFNLQFMKNEQSQYVITDINLRTAGGMSLSYAAGWDEVSALARIMLKKSAEEVFVSLPQNLPEQYVIRAYTDIVTKTERPVVAFDLDGTLLDSRKRHQVVMDDVLKKFNLTLDTSDLVGFKRQGKNNVDYLISKGIDEKLAKEIQKKWIENIEQPEYLKGDKLYSDALQLLDEYGQANDLILVTARNNADGVYGQLKDLGLKKYFKEIFVVPTGAAASEEKANILRKEVVSLMVGDTASDAKSARLAGVSFKFHENGFHSKESIGE